MRKKTVDEETRWKEIVEEMIQQTLSDRLVWSTMGETPTARTEDAIQPIYHASVLGKMVEVYAYEYRIYRDEDEWYTSKEVAIEFVDYGGLRWRWPTTEGRWLLLDAIRQREFKTREFADQFHEAFLKRRDDDDIPF